MSSSPEKEVRIGIIGLGNMGANHARAIRDGKITGGTLGGLCDQKGDNFADFPGTPTFPTSHELIASGLVDALIIATPHYSHTTIGQHALSSGLPVLVEKPISAHKIDCERLIAAHVNEQQIFAAMFNQRTDPHFLKVREILQAGRLGPVRRIQWTITDWFRTQAYYDSGGWRATWAGEGGGVLLNQCPHQLDLWQWLFGMPNRVRGFCQIGRYHDIEVEDDVTAYFEYANGTTGTFITSTGEAPGTNRLEVAGDLGRLVLEKNTIHLLLNDIPMDEFCRTNPGRFVAPPTSEQTLEIEDGRGPQHTGIIQNFVDAILTGAPLIAPAREGIYSVELANAILQSSFEDRTVDLPLDSSSYDALLQTKIADSQFVKKQQITPQTVDDFSASFSR